MRYYSILIGGAPGVFPAVPGASVPGAQWDTWVNGRNDPEAQQIEFSIEEFRPNLPSAESTLTIHGVAFAQIKASADLTGLPIKIFGGMKPGLPLATMQSKHAGLLMEGRIIRCWGHWIGTEMSIGMSFVPAGVANADSGDGGGGGGGGDGGGGGGGNGGGGGGAGAQSVQRQFNRVGHRSIDFLPFARGHVARMEQGPVVIVEEPPVVGATLDFGAGGFSPMGGTSVFGGFASSFFGGGFSGLQAPLNLIHNMLPNMPLQSAIHQTLSKAFPRANLDVNISSALKLPYQDAGMYQSLQQFSGYVQKLSHSILGIKDYLGVQHSSYDNTIHVWDGTTPVGGGVVDISALELIGQPTWILPKTISIKTVLRADIHCGSYITIPPTLVGTTSDSQIPGLTGGLPEQKVNPSFSGVFLVTRVLYIGDFRNPDGAGWSSNYEAVFQGATTGQNDTSQAVTDSNAQQNPEGKPAPGEANG